MLTGGQDAVLDKEEARIRLRRKNNEDRRERLLNARKRVIGVDVDALDAQVAEMHRGRNDDKEALRVERIRQMEIERVLESAAEEERMMRAYQKEEIKKSWMQAIEAKRNIAPEPILDPRLAGPSAAQNFAGADPNRAERIKAQKDQMRRWVQEQVAEKAHIKAKESQELAAYSDMLKAIEEIRDVADREEVELSRFSKRSVKEQNDVLAAARRQRWAEEKASWTSLPAETKAAATSIDLRENESLAIDANGRIVRKDMFRGFTEAQRRRIILENELLLQHKRESEHAQDSSDRQWVVQQMLASQAMEQANYQEKLLAQEETQLNLAVLKQQMLLQAQKREQGQKGKFGQIEPGFFNNFGTSCR